MECAVAFVVFFVIAIIWAFLTSGGQGGYTSNDELQRAVDRGLTVHCTDNTFTDEEGRELPVVEVSISGLVAVPHANCPCALRVWITDVTGGEDEPYAVYCMIRDVADENGIFTIVENMTLPHELSEVQDMGVAGVPSFALVLPHKGQRQLRMHVALTSQWDEQKVYTYGSTTFWHTQETVGYMELEAHTREQERQISQLALSVAAVTGSVDKRNLAVIRRFFASRLEGEEDAQERRQTLTQQLQETMDAIKRGAKQPSELMIEICRDIAAGDQDDAFRHTCYELCVEVAAADEKIHQREEEALQFIAAQLNIPAEFAREAHDRNLRLHMYGEADGEAAIGMPTGLSHEEKIDFLNKEYTKWRGRATHKDPKVAAEASLRLERITKLRQQLTEATDDDPS